MNDTDSTPPSARRPAATAPVRSGAPDVAGSATSGADRTAVAGSPLRRAIRLPHATALVVGIIIGASIFVQPSEITREVPSVAGIFGVWTAAGLLTVAGALICAELASAFPESGGVYVFLRETLSPAVAFLWGWAMFWSMHSGIIAAIAVIFARYLAYFVPLDPVGVNTAAIGAVLAVSAVNWAGVRHGSGLQAAFTAVKLLAVALMIAAGFALGADAAGLVDGTGAGAAAGPMGGAGAAAGAGGAASGAAGLAALLSPERLGAFGRAVAAGLFAFGGWHMVTYTAGETSDAARTVPRALAIGIAIVVLCYIALNAVYLYVLPVEAVIASQRVAADAADAVLGSGGGAFMSGLVVFSTFGALAGLVLVGPRVYHSMAEDGLLFRWIARVHPRRGTPDRAIALQAVWSCVLVATGSYRALFGRVIYTEWIFFALMAAGLFLLRRSPDYAPSYRVPGYPVVPALFILASLAVAGSEIAARPADAAIGLALVLAGVPVYALWRRRRTRAETAAND